MKPQLCRAQESLLDEESHTNLQGGGGTMGQSNVGASSLSMFGLLPILWDERAQISDSDNDVDFGNGIHD